MVSIGLQPLRDWLAAHPSSPEMSAETKGGDRHDRPDGTRVLTMPRPVYATAINEFWAALDASGWEEIDTRNYVDTVRRWKIAHGVDAIGPHHLLRMDRDILANVLRFYQRGKRFSDGIWRAAFKEGIFHAAARALIALG